MGPFANGQLDCLVGVREMELGCASLLKDNWRKAKLLLAEDLTADTGSALPKLHGALLKNEQDVHLFERLAFLARSQR